MTSLSLITAWGSFLVRCANCNKALSGWYPTRALAVCEVDRNGAIVRMDYDGMSIVACCPSCAKAHGKDGWWAKNQPLPPELVEFYPEATP